MEVRVRLRVADYSATSLSQSNVTMHTVEVSDDMTMRDLFKVLPTEHVTHLEENSYYPVSSVYLRRTHREIQYVVTSSGIVWYPSYDEVRVIDFMRTVGGNKTLNLVTNLTGFGGNIGGVDVTSFIDVIGIIGFAITLWDKKKSVTWIGKYIPKWIRRGKKIPALSDTGAAAEHPGAFMSYLFSKEQWNPHALSADTGMAVERCHFFLKACGYKYDNKTMLFHASSETPNIAKLVDSLPFASYMQEYNDRQTKT